jgi:hypothetical protein
LSFHSSGKPHSIASSPISRNDYRLRECNPRIL